MMPSSSSKYSFERKPSLEGLLFELYDKWQPVHHCRFESESNTDSLWSDGGSTPRNRKEGYQRFSETYLNKLTMVQLKKIVAYLQSNIYEQSQLLVRYLKRRDYQLSRMQVRCNMVTAVLQALSPKRSVDAKLHFTPDPPPTENGYEQWLNAMKAVARLPDGMPQHFRQKLWLTLADHYVKSAQIDWEETRRLAFNDRMNPDDDELSLQIVKDLHRTGWSGLDGDKERVLLRRVLLAYARYNKTIGYCQGFNVIAALILEVTEYKEEQALKVMIMLIENVLPSNYFDQTLRALSVDMAVLRDLMHHRLPKLSAHLDQLQENSDSEFEPPLINVFSMQWFLTLFATCLPKHAVHRVWDSLMLEGSEILLRAALALWAKIGKRVYRAKSADAFYTLMGIICQELSEMTTTRCDELMQVIYTMAEFPYPGLDELRDRHMWNIQPFSTAFRLLRQQAYSILKSDSEEVEHEKHSSSKLSSPNLDDRGKLGVKSNHSAADLNALEKQYKLLRQRQKQAAIILQNALTTKGKSPFPAAISGKNGEKTEMFNHLYFKEAGKNTVTTSAAFNGTLSVASKVIQPSGKAKKSTEDPRSRRISSTSTTTITNDLTSPTYSEVSTPTAETIETPSDIGWFPFHPTEPGHRRRSRSLDVNWLKRFYSNRKVSVPGRRSQSCINFRHITFHQNHSRRQSSDFKHFTKTFSSSVNKKKTRPPPLVLTAVNSSAQVNSQYVSPSPSSSSTKTRNETASTKTKPNYLLQKSKAILNSFPEPNDSGKIFNPFPTKRQTTLIEREKRLGLYS